PPPRAPHPLPPRRSPDLDHDAAASYARQLASAQAESGALELAIKSYHKVLAHAPRDISAHDRLFQTLLQLEKPVVGRDVARRVGDRKSTRLNSSHDQTSY